MAARAVDKIIHPYAKLRALLVQPISRAYRNSPRGALDPEHHPRRVGARDRANALVLRVALAPGWRVRSHASGEGAAGAVGNTA
jgi:hypothetical protein